MTSRLDEVFSSEKLRQSWQMQIKPAPVPKQTALNFDIHAKYHELQRLIDEEFSDTSRLTGRFDELTNQINQTFTLDLTSRLIDANQKQTIVELLEQLEELLWAMSLPERGQR